MNNIHTARRYAATALILILLSTGVFLACQKAPITGRSQLILISEQQELEMGLLAFQEVTKNEKLSTSPEYNSAVKRVMTRIADVSDQPTYEWEYKVIDNPETINAFALPGGKVGIYTGILPIAGSDAGLATVMGHEVAHATARHGGERVSMGILAQLGAVGINAALSKSDAGVVQLVNAAYGLGVMVGGILPFSRKQEAEADHIGLIYMARAGYHPSEAIEFWDRMHEATKDSQKPPEFLSTHPGYKTRKANLRKWQPQAMWHYDRAKKAPSNTITSLESGSLGDYMLSAAVPSPAN